MDADTCNTSNTTIQQHEAIISVPTLVAPTPSGQKSVVVAEARVPQSASEDSPIVDMLMALLPDSVTSATGAKRACRRGEVLLDGAPARTTSKVNPGQLLQLTMRCQPSAHTWITAGPPAPAPAGPSNSSSSSSSSSSSKRGPQPGCGQLQLPHAEKHPQQATEGAAAAAAAAVAAAASSTDVAAMSSATTTPGSLPPTSLCHRGDDVPPLLEVVFEDDHMAVVIKPPGLETQGGGLGTACGRLLYCLRPSSVPGVLRKPCHVHRLDAPTGGLLLVAKTRPALQRLTQQLAERQVDKRYVALVKGQRAEGSQGSIELELDGQAATSHFAAVRCTPSATFGRLTTVHLWPRTGRTHQLRKHMAYTGTPILGDTRYRGPRATAPATAAAETTATAGAAVAGAAQQASDGGGGGAHAEPPPPARGAAAQVDAAAAAAAAAPASLTAACGLLPGPSLSGGGCGRAQQQPKQQQQQTPASPAHPVQQRQPCHQPGAGHYPELQVSGCQHLQGGTDEELCLEQARSQQWQDPATRLQQAPHGQPQQTQQKAKIHARQKRAAAGEVAVGDVLCDGTGVGLCLWAVELRFTHPITGQPMQLSIPEPPVYERIRVVEAAGATGCAGEDAGCCC